MHVWVCVSTVWCVLVSDFLFYLIFLSNWVFSGFRLCLVPPSPLHSLCLFRKSRLIKKFCPWHLISMSSKHTHTLSRRNCCWIQPFSLVLKCFIIWLVFFASSDLHPKHISLKSTQFIELLCLLRSADSLKVFHPNSNHDLMPIFLYLATDFKLAVPFRSMQNVEKIITRVTFSDKWTASLAKLLCY